MVEVKLNYGSHCLEVVTVVVNPVENWMARSCKHVAVVELLNERPLRIRPSNRVQRFPDCYPLTHDLVSLELMIAMALELMPILSFLQICPKPYSPSSYAYANKDQISRSTKF